MTSRSSRHALLAVLVLAGAQPLHAQQECPRGKDAAVTLLTEWIELVRRDDGDAMTRMLRRAWEPGDAARGALDEAIVNGGQFAALSEGLQEERLCAEADTVVYGEYRNATTRAVDRVRMTVTGSGGIVSLAIGYAVRTTGQPLSRGAAGLPSLDGYLTHLSTRGAFAGVVLVARDGKPLYTRVVGQANRRLGTPIDTSTPFNLASLSKMFTAVAVMQLVERGVVRLDDRLQTLLPEEFGDPTYADIQVKHLLSHTSGLGMYNNTRVFAPAGSRFAYSNTGFKVLGDIVARPTGMRFEDYLRLRVFGPAGMATAARYEFQALNEEAPLGYYYPIPAVNDRVELIPNKYLHIYSGSGMGGFYASSMDLLRFAEALRQGRLVRRETLEVMKQPKPELGAPEYGFGIMRWRAPGGWGHSGRLPGADADLEFYDNGHVAIVLANLDHVNDPVLLRLRAMFHEMRPARTAPAVRGRPPTAGTSS